MNSALLGEARFYFAQCVFNTSCQYAAYDRYSKKRSTNTTIAKWISGGTIVLLILIIICHETTCSSLLPILSVFGLIGTAASLIFEIYNKADLSEIMFYHKQSAEDYKGLREKFMDVIRQIKGGSNLQESEKRLQQCLHDYTTLGQYSLSTNNDDYLKAQKNLGLNGVGEGFTWSSQEIDKFLPEELRENA